MISLGKNKKKSYLYRGSRRAIRLEICKIVISEVKEEENGMVRNLPDSSLARYYIAVVDILTGKALSQRVIVLKMCHSVLLVSPADPG